MPGDAAGEAGGDALIGRRLYPLLRGAGFGEVQVSPRMVYADASRPEMVDGFTRKTFTAMVEAVREPALEAGLVTAAVLRRGHRGSLPDGGRRWRLLLHVLQGARGQSIHLLIARCCCRYELRGETLHESSFARISRKRRAAVLCQVSKTVQRPLRPAQEGRSSSHRLRPTFITDIETFWAVNVRVGEEQWGDYERTSSRKAAPQG